MTKEKMIKPQYIIDYNNTMDVVDKVDFLYILNSARKSLKWYKKVFFHLLDLAVYNTFVLYNRVTERNLFFANFHLCLIKQIFKKYHSNRTNVIKVKDKNTEDEPFDTKMISVNTRK